jgi:hypothetical protein
LICLSKSPSSFVAGDHPFWYRTIGVAHSFELQMQIVALVSYTFACVDTDHYGSLYFRVHSLLSFGLFMLQPLSLSVATQSNCAISLLLSSNWMFSAALVPPE